MGQTQSGGFGILNLSSFEVHMGLSMAGTHYYENSVSHGKIFYRWPGAVHYTVYAQVSPEITDGTAAKELVTSSVIGVTTAVATIASAGLAGAPIAAALSSAGGVATAGGAIIMMAEGGAVGITLTVGCAAAAGGATDYALTSKVMPYLLTIPEADKYAKLMGCYGGGSGTWLVLKGGMYKKSNGDIAHAPLSLEVSTQEYVMSSGTFTDYSNPKFYSKDADLPLCAGPHDCRRVGCKPIL